MLHQVPSALYAESWCDVLDLLDALESDLASAPRAASSAADVDAFLATLANGK